MNIWLAAASLCAWFYLTVLHGRFWISGPQLAAAAAPLAAAALPAVDVVIPARDEAATIGRTIASLVRQDYAGEFRIILVDDESSDGTAALAGTAGNLQILTGRRKPAGWSGKLWALEQGVAAGTAPLLLFADADIVHHAAHLGSLVQRMTDGKLDLVSEMVRLNCSSFAERLLVPAFVYFFQMLYPFARVNDPTARTAAAAGGSVLIRREVLQRIGGLGAIRQALIDDVTLARAVKAGGGRLYLGHSQFADSVRPYPAFKDIWRMIARTAFVQLRHSALLLALTLAGLTLLWFVPLAEAVWARGPARTLGATALLLSLATYLPTLRRYRVSAWWAPALPLIAAFYLAATVGSAIDHWRGAGARWKNRAYGAG